MFRTFVQRINKKQIVDNVYSGCLATVNKHQVVDNVHLIAAQNNRLFIFTTIQHSDGFGGIRLEVIICEHTHNLIVSIDE